MGSTVSMKRSELSSDAAWYALWDRRKPAIPIETSAYGCQAVNAVEGPPLSKKVNDFVSRASSAKQFTAAVTKNEARQVVHLRAVVAERTTILITHGLRDERPYGEARISSATGRLPR